MFDIRKGKAMKNGRVYIDHETCIKIIMKAAENNGRVILEAKGFPMFEISMNVDLAKKERQKLSPVIKELYRE